MRAVIGAIDGSPTSDAVLDAAASLAGLLARPVHAFHVSDDLDADAIDTAMLHGISMSLIEGDPEQEVIRRFGASDVRIAVIGSRGTPVGAVPAGHLACRAMESIRVPLVVVPPVIARPLVAPGPVLVPLDGTHESAEAVRPVLELLRAANVELVVLHAFHEGTVPAFWDRPVYDTEEWGSEFRERFVGHRRASVDLARGEPGEQILLAITAHDAVLVVLGWACDLGTGHADTVRRMLTDATVPVLLLPTCQGVTHVRF
jgi:nucleotide-binding universal stress UspA family protein